MNSADTIESTGKLTRAEIEAEAAFRGLDIVDSGLRRSTWYRWSEQVNPHAKTRKLIIGKAIYTVVSGQSSLAHIWDSSREDRTTKYVTRTPNPGEDARTVALDTSRDGSLQRRGKIELYLGNGVTLAGQRALDSLDDAFPELFPPEVDQAAA